MSGHIFKEKPLKNLKQTKQNNMIQWHMLGRGNASGKG